MSRDSVHAAAAAARDAWYAAATMTTQAKNAVLRDAASALEARHAEIVAANAADLAAAKAAGLPDAKLRRLVLSPGGVSQLAAGLRAVADLPDPVGEVTRQLTTPAGLRVRRVRVPLGVVAMIYEARPGVTADAFALCFKAGNACLLKGGKEAARSNTALAAVLADVLTAHGVPPAVLGVLTDLSRDDLAYLLSLDGLIDLAIPRGGAELIRFVADHARMPTIQHFHGVCHIYVDRSADLARAVEVCATAKTSAPATCNAAECYLVHREIAPRFVPMLSERLDHDGVELRGDEEICRLTPAASPASPDDFGKEFLDLIAAARVVGGVDEAIAHVRRYGSMHTDAVLAEDQAVARRFVAGVPSSCVVVNASTRFNDGFQLGLGAEIGISTSRLHAFGPMGLEELTIQRFEVEGRYQTR